SVLSFPFVADNFTHINCGRGERDATTPFTRFTASSSAGRSQTTFINAPLSGASPGLSAGSPWLAGDDRLARASVRPRASGACPEHLPTPGHEPGRILAPQCTAPAAPRQVAPTIHPHPIHGVSESVRLLLEDSTTIADTR